MVEIAHSSNITPMILLDIDVNKTKTRELLGFVPKCALLIVILIVIMTFKIYVVNGSQIRVII
jgi:hypothetical protein